MNYEQAIQILDPETSAEAVRILSAKHKDADKVIDKVNEACTIAVKALEMVKKLHPLQDQTYDGNPLYYLS